MRKIELKILKLLIFVIIILNICYVFTQDAPQDNKINFSGNIDSNASMSLRNTDKPSIDDIGSRTGEDLLNNTSFNKPKRQL